MRVCLVVHGFPPLERTGVENYTASLAAALTGAGHRVEVFAPRVAPELADWTLRREERGGFGLTWITTNHGPRDPREMLDPPGVAERFGEFLDRERPEIVHFQHVIKLGVGLVHEAARRGIATVYTAHDYYPVCHRFTLLKPDLSRCETLNDPAACARCDLALAWLNERPELGDYQMGALPEQLDERGAAGLAAVLAGEPGPETFPPELHEQARAQRTALDARRAETFAELDLVIAPTRFLAGKLVEGGLAAKRIELLPYGIETDELAGVSPPGVDPAGGARPRLRFGFLGGLGKHKGVHVVLEAFRKMREPAELFVWGDSSDRPYVERMRQLAQEVGAVWNGPYGRDELAGALEQVDVVVVPSIWYENYPIVIREAFAAGLPVIASDVGALPESVTDGVDGLLFAPGDSDALAAAMQRLVLDPALLRRLRQGIRPVDEMGAQVRDLEALYESVLADRRAAPGSDLPAHLAPLFERWNEVDRLPTRDLLSRVLSGLGTLRARLPGVAERVSVEQLLVEGLSGGSRAQVLMRDLKRERDWLHETLSSHEAVERELEKRLEWREGQLASEETELEWLRGVVSEMKRELVWLRDEKEHQDRAATERQATLAEREREAAWLRETEQNRARELAWRKREQENLGHEVEWLRSKVAELEGELDWRRETAAHAEQELAWRREGEDVLEDKVRALEAEVAGARGELAQTAEALARWRERFRQAAEVGLVALQAQERVVGHELRPLLDALDEAVGGAARAASAEGGESVGVLVRDIRRGVERLRRIDSELTWRRGEMDGAIEQLDRPTRFLIRRTGLGRRVEEWARAQHNGAHGSPGSPRARGIRASATERGPKGGES